MFRDAGGESAFDAAVRRLEQALAGLEQRIARKAAAPAPAQVAGDEALKAELARLNEELQEARRRERELETAGASASAALGRAIAEIRNALGEDALADVEV